MKLLLALFVFLMGYSVHGQSSYVGVLGEYPITLIAYHYNYGDSRAHYVYDQYDTPIVINGRMEAGGLELYERNEKGDIQATLSFPEFDEEALSVSGVWISGDGTIRYAISLNKEFDIEKREKYYKREVQLLQAASTKEHYFKTLIEKDSISFFGGVSGVNIYEKRTDRLVQSIRLDCQLYGVDHVSVADYNFDGIDDFSVFELSYAGSNTSSIYILRDPNSEKYFVSTYSGISLEFDQEKKLVYEHNQCCGGVQKTVTSYRVVNDKMVYVEKKCLNYSQAKAGFVEVECD